ncbi:MAG: type II CAAX endopeptidase family protein [Clostridiaceae bacterium]|nr:type II CAAX endopeptidase family protein [Clostridiaceae bacterium]
MDTNSRFKYLKQSIGYYFLVVVCQIVGEVIVLFSFGWKDISNTNMPVDEMMEAMLKILNAHIYGVLLATYLAMGLILLGKRLKASAPLTLVDGISQHIDAGQALWGALMGAGGSLWSLILVEILPKNQSAFETITSAESSVVSAEPFWLELLAVIVIAPVFEEIIFRGLIFSRLRLIMAQPGAVICQALMFASLHTGESDIIRALVLGAVLGFAVIKAKSLRAAIVIHVAFNAVALLANPFYDMMFKTEFTIKLMLIIGGCVFALGAVAYFKTPGRGSNVAESK